MIINLERTGRGEAPFAAMTAQLDSYAASGAQGDTDPSHPGSLSGGAAVYQTGSIWAGGASTTLFASYLWMYEDGWGGSPTTTTNADCSGPGATGCWAHRDIILKQFNSAYCQGAAPVLSMGVGDTGPTSVAAVLVSSCQAPSDPVFTWGEAEAALGGDGPPAAASASPSVPAAPATPTYSEKQLLAAFSPTAIVDIASSQSGHGYWLAAADGAVYGYGNAPIYGSMLGAPLSAPIVGIAATPDGRGYWLVASDGGIFSYGDAPYFGSTGALHLNAPIVGIAATPDGDGYWLVGSDGGIFSFGDAGFHGSMGGQTLNQPVVAVTADPQTGGYWEVATDGGIFAFDAPFSGSTGNEALNAPIVGMQAAPSGQGYRMDATDGGVFSFSLPFLGSMGGGAVSSSGPGHGDRPRDRRLLGGGGRRRGLQLRCPLLGVRRLGASSTTTPRRPREGVGGKLRAATRAGPATGRGWPVPPFLFGGRSRSAGWSRLPSPSGDPGHRSTGWTPSPTAPSAGNPAAVCLLDGPADERWMQALAKEIGLSETAYVWPGPDAHSLRWFTPVAEVDLCGHATVAAAAALRAAGRAADGETVTFSTRSGVLGARLDGAEVELDLPAERPEEVVVPTALSDLAARRAARGPGTSWSSWPTPRPCAPSGSTWPRWPPSEFGRSTSRPTLAPATTCSGCSPPRWASTRTRPPGRPTASSAPTGATRLGRTTLAARQLSARGATFRVTVGQRCAVRWPGRPHRLRRTGPGGVRAEADLRVVERSRCGKDAVWTRLPPSATTPRSRQPPRLALGPPRRRRPRSGVEGEVPRRAGPTQPTPCDPTADPVHVTASAVVAGTRGTVLHLHRRLGRWMQPGGHVDPGESPPDAGSARDHRGDRAGGPPSAGWADPRQRRRPRGHGRPYPPRPALSARR